MWHAVPSMKSRLHYIPAAAPRFFYGFIKLYVVLINWLSSHNGLERGDYFLIRLQTSIAITPNWV